MKVLRPLCEGPEEGPGRSQLLHHEASIRVARFHLGVGEEVEPHRSDSTVLLHVIEGAGRFRSGDDEVVLSRGESALFAPEEEHGVEATEVPVTFLAVIAPGPR